jgi:hypothetical protein
MAGAQKDCEISRVKRSMRRRVVALKKLSCFLLLAAGISLQTAAAVPTGIPGTDTNAGVDYYLCEETEIDEKTLIEYVAKSTEDEQKAVAVLTKVLGTDTNSEVDYYISSDADSNETASMYYQPAEQREGDHYCSYGIAYITPTPVPGMDANAEEDYDVIAFSPNKSAEALHYGAQIGKGIY